MKFVRTLLLALSLLLITKPVTAWEVTDHSFKCIKHMKQVENFFVDNLLGNLEGTVAVATAGQGVYPEGSVLQLMPNEVMVKRHAGFSPATNDWEFFWIDLTKDGSVIYTRGAVEVNNRLNLNCVGCHVKAKPEFDFVCRKDHGCDPVGIRDGIWTALQNTDPRCPGSDVVSAEDQQALAELGAIVEELTKSQQAPAQE